MTLRQAQGRHLRHRGGRGIGKVFLVGAGPGRADLLTLRGARCLASADAVVLDALVNPRLLDLCRPGLQIVNAGKRGHGAVALRQMEINRLLVRLACAGKRVVRLKGGDPYFFGRGGEEALYLARRKIPFEVVPGVSSVSAVPAYAGVPLTHRQHTSMVTVITGHPGRENTYLAVPPRGASGVDWARISPQGTLVVLMGVSQLPDIVRRLRENGWSSATPAAAVRWGTYPSQTIVEGTLGNLADRARRAGLRAPAVVVAGSVVSLRPALAWFERLPLFGRRIVVTRAASQASELADLLEDAGAEVVLAPTIRVEPLTLRAAARRMLKDIPTYDGVLFTSANAARLFHERWSSQVAGPWPPNVLVYAVGPKTAEALVRCGLPVHGVAQEFISDALLPLASPAAGKHFLFPRAEEAREELVRGLRSAGSVVDILPLYRTSPVKVPPRVRRALAAGQIDAVAFTSSSTVRFFMRNFHPAERRRLFSRALAASIGPVTSAALRDLGVRPAIQARVSTVDGLAAAIQSRLRKPSSAERTRKA